MRKPANVRFWKHVRVTPTCWLWTGTRSKATGYGKFNNGVTIVSAHRFAYEAANGPTQQWVLHRCDNPPCVRPSHLFAGTAKDNMRDMDAKGRRVNAQLRGDAHGRARLTRACVIEARARWQAGGADASVRGLARVYGVSCATMHAALVGKTWKP